LLGGLAWSFVGPARLTALAQMARPDELRPATIIFNLQVLVGFGLAPLVIGMVRSRAGWGMVLAIAASGFALASLLIINLRSHTVSRQMPQKSVFADIREGFQVVGSDPLLRQLMLAAVLAYAMTGPLQILLPKVAREVLLLSELQRGAYLGLLALSLIVGGVSALALAKQVRHGWVVFGGVIGGSLVFASLGSITDAVTSSAALACVGVGGGMVISLLVSGIQAQAPHALRGRVMGMYSIISQVVPAFSGVAAGALVSAVGTVVAVQGCGLGLAVIAVVASWRMPAVRRVGSH